MNEFRRYIFLLDENGKTGLDAAWLSGTELTKDAALLRHANRLLKMNALAVEAYVMPYYTPEMSEMMPRELGSFVKKIGRLITFKK